MKVLVTGAAGFIGQHVVKALQDAANYVISVDMVKPSRGAWLEADITKPLTPVPDLDAVIHLAALSHPRQCDEDPRRAFDVNVNGTHQVLKMALASGAKKVVFSSSAHVYGISPKWLPTPENHPLYLQNTYTISKILGEQLCHLYYENHGLSYTTLRLYNAYGPGQGLGYFIPDMIQRAIIGKIDLPGANTTKDWVFVEDVARAFVSAVQTDFVGAINIGSGVETPLSEIASKIASIAGAKFAHSDSPTASRMCADIRRANRVLSWNPTISLEEGLDVIHNLEKA